MLILEFLFFVGAGALVYTYIGFPAVLWTWRAVRGRRRPPDAAAAAVLPTLSIIVAAYNEEANVAARVENLRRQAYPADRMEILVASDGSTDGTVRVARQMPGIRVLAYPVNRGKASVHNDSVREARNDIIVFTDAETEFEPEFLREAVRFFEDPRYGCGAGEYSFRPRGTIGASEAAYWRMEKSIRRLEHDVGVLPFASGGCFLLRRELYQPIETHSDIDNIIPLTTIERGFDVFYAARARAYDVTVAQPGSHYRKRVRTAQRSATDILGRVPALWRARRYAALFVLISHRGIRWLGGYFAALALLATIGLFALRPGSVWAVMLAAEAFALVCAGIGMVAARRGAEGARSLPVMRAAYSFALANLAFCEAMANVARRRRIQSWKTTS